MFAIMTHGATAETVKTLAVLIQAHSIRVSAIHQCLYSFRTGVVCQQLHTPSTVIVQPALKGSPVDKSLYISTGIMKHELGVRRKGSIIAVTSRRFS
jgi:hypothetical protein